MDEKASRRSSASPWLRYMGLAGQFIAAIALGFWLGHALDLWFKFAFPWFTLSLPAALIVGMLLKLVRETTRNSQRNDRPRS